MTTEDKLNKLLGQGENSGFFNELCRFEKELDISFGIDCSVEELINDTSEDVYGGLEMMALSTSYLDYYRIFLDLGKEGVLVDLGAGYCRGTMLGAKLGYECVSVEIEKSRIQNQQKEFPKSILNLNILDQNFNLPDGDAYFIYLPWGELSNKIFKLLLELEKEVAIYIIESHGDFVENMNCFKGNLQQVEFTAKTSYPRHDRQIYKYTSKNENSLKAINREDYGDKDLLGLWIVKFYSSVKSIEVETINSNGEPYRWSASFKSSYFCYYNGRPSLYIKEKSRYLQYQYDTIVAVEFEESDQRTFIKNV